MAIKERKQITGTTAQINAYAGHEGQIVWDKEKKTFVGMSGTAGENYPLASQTYVANEVAKCLPLTGGSMLGSINVKAKTESGASVYCSTEGGEIQICAGAKTFETVTNGSALTLRTKPTEGLGEVSFSIDAKSASGVYSLTGAANGSLHWCNKEIDSIVQQSTGVVRYASGLQLVWFKAPITTTRDEIHSWVLTYPLPFVKKGLISVSINLRGNWGYATTIQLEGVEEHACNGTLRRNDGGTTNNADIHCIAIGYWK